ncbi:HAMP domain-containing histidine kinase [bacterium]|nr:HAMP domain-containing histidine kinase [bacterium]
MSEQTPLPGVDRSQETGVMSSLPFEARQFISACRIASAYCVIAVVVNLVGGVTPALLALIISLFILLEWMRYKAQRYGISSLLRWGFALATSISLALAYLLNGGLNGSVPMVYLLALFLAMSISESQRAPIFCLYLASAVFCLVVEGVQPEWIMQYSSGRLQFLDSAIGLLMAMFALGYGTHQFKSSYDRQRVRVQHKNDEVSRAYLKAQASNDRLQEVMRRNHEHLHIIAHDLRNPVGAVIGLVEVCREEYELNEGLAKDLSTMEQAASQALELVQHLSEVAYLEERKVILQKGLTELAPILERVLRKLEPSARKKHQSLHWELDSSLKAEVDSNRMASILDNLVENAVKYSPLESRIEVLLEKQGDKAIVRVRDQGPGVPEDQKAKLFTMFGKVGNRPTGKESSTGLGLYIAKMLTELHGGQLEQENLSPGTEFRLILSAG